MPAPSLACRDELVAANTTLVLLKKNLKGTSLEFPVHVWSSKLAGAHSQPRKYFWHLEDDYFELQGLLTGQRISLKNKDWIEAMYMGAGHFGDLKLVVDNNNLDIHIFNGDGSKKCAKLALE
ncbi:hypothetical protein SELMODRAFT_417832 [Selaginella moellendorffii]|uniref:Uncharacterized protein n=1 Tax=Selaginella moellendorffii TaxID=88036 RepID=D8S3S8_SELML|nr:hypothetical protein SELMODRAFT_417832 [Selaginella moellendorffii]